jgi:wobble nucleotide-excising tRNase
LVAENQRQRTRLRITLSTEAIRKSWVRADFSIRIALSTEPLLTSNLPLLVGRGGESAEAWRTVLGDLIKRGLRRDAIARLTENPEIAIWVERGHVLHNELGSKECEFCQQTVPAERWKQLDAHFSTADQELKEEIESSLVDTDRLKQTISTVALPDRMAFYSDLRSKFHKAKSELDSACRAALADLDDIVARLDTKLASRSSAISFESGIDLQPFETAWVAVVAVMKAHNEKTSSFDQAKESARNEIETHYLTSVMQSVTEFDQLIAEENKVIKEAKDGSEEDGIIGLTALQDSINEKNTAYLLEMIKELAPQHYQGMMVSTTQLQPQPTTTNIEDLQGIAGKATPVISSLEASRV